MPIKDVMVPLELSLLMEKNNVQVFFNDDENPRADWSIDELVDDYLEVLTIPGDTKVHDEHKDELEVLEKALNEALLKVKNMKPY
jgi:hypothetical protein